LNEQELQSLLASMRQERMDRIADDRIRALLETAWTTRQQQRSTGFRARRVAPVLATGVMAIGLGTATMSALGDSPLYGMRVALEDAAIALHADPEDRTRYVLSLLDDRQAEAARLEATGNAAAASRARAIEADTVRIARAMLPQSPELPAPAPATSGSPTAAPTPSTPSPTPTPASTPMPSSTPTDDRLAHASATPTPRSTATPIKSPTPTATPTKTQASTPAPTGMLVAVYGFVKNADGTPANGVCVRLNTASVECLTTTGADGTYRVSMSKKINESITLYLTRQEGTILWKATATMTVKSASVQMPDVKLAKY
jgi:hypothetical protein